MRSSNLPIMMIEIWLQRLAQIQLWKSGISESAQILRLHHPLLRHLHHQRLPFTVIGKKVLFFACSFFYCLPSLSLSLFSLCAVFAIDWPSSQICCPSVVRDWFETQDQDLRSSEPASAAAGSAVVASRPSALAGPSSSSSSYGKHSSFVNSWSSCSPFSSFPWHSSDIIDFSFNENRFVTGDGNGEIIRWDLRYPRPVCRSQDPVAMQNRGSPGPRSIDSSSIWCLQSCGQFLIAGTVNHTVLFYSALTLECQYQLDFLIQSIVFKVMASNCLSDQEILCFISLTLQTVPQISQRQPIFRYRWLMFNNSFKKSNNNSDWRITILDDSRKNMLLSLVELSIDRNGTEAEGKERKKGRTSKKTRLEISIFPGSNVFLFWFHWQWETKEKMPANSKQMRAHYRRTHIHSQLKCTESVCYYHGSRATIQQEEAVISTWRNCSGSVQSSDPDIDLLKRWLVPANASPQSLRNWPFFTRKLDRDKIEKRRWSVNLTVTYKTWTARSNRNKKIEDILRKQNAAVTGQPIHNQKM